uniref:Uncharacterized protein n=1 Tax=Aegilops tauschii TaxID=37682 RepID=N1QX78_AEGTA
MAATSRMPSVRLVLIGEHAKNGVSYPQLHIQQPGFLLGWTSCLHLGIQLSCLRSSWPEIAKFQNKPFPLYDKLGDLYDDAAPSDVSRDAAPSDGSRDAAPSGGPRDVAQTGAPGGSNKKPVKEPKKKKRDDPMGPDLAEAWATTRCRQKSPPHCCPQTCLGAFAGQTCVYVVMNH